jgi:hypothetical protein
MGAAVIDTNVLLVANGSHTGATPSCREVCVKRLLEQQREGVTVIDDGYRILREYQQKTSPNQPKGVGDAFLKWLLQNTTNGARVHQVAITETQQDTYAEFPDGPLQTQFDPSDRKFVAVANAHPSNPSIWQAADSKWWGWAPALKKKGLQIDFLCPEQLEKTYRQKFPQRRTR